MIFSSSKIESSNVETLPGCIDLIEGIVSHSYQIMYSVRWKDFEPGQFLGCRRHRRSGGQEVQRQQHPRSEQQYQAMGGKSWEKCTHKKKKIKRVPVFFFTSDESWSYKANNPTQHYMFVQDARTRFKAIMVDMDRKIFCLWKLWKNGSIKLGDVVAGGLSQKAVSIGCVDSSKTQSKQLANPVCTFIELKTKNRAKDTVRRFRGGLRMRHNNW